MFDFTPCPALTLKSAGLPRDRRPSVLMRAARVGASLYRRRRDLREIMPGLSLHGRRGADIVARLALAEEQMETARREGRPGYAPRRHVGVLSALLAERAALAPAAVR